MDTRHKIVPVSAIREAGPVVLIIGYFDPLHAAYISRLREILSTDESHVIAVDDPAAPLLPRQARAELVASLAGVRYVVTDVQQARERLATARVCDLRAEHDALRQSLAAHVIRRHSGE